MVRTFINIAFILFYCGDFVHAQSFKNLSQEPLEIQYPTREVSLPMHQKYDSTTYIQENLDSVQHLAKVVIISPFQFNTKEERRQYLILRYKTRKVWPYAVLASKRLETLRSRLDSLDNKKEKAAYTRRVQRYMEDEFKDQLKKLTRTEGQILIKLLYRQTGDSTFDIIKDLRSGFRAFRYNLTAGIFTISLKKEYDPLEVKEDYIIEHILQWAFQHNQLEKQNSAIDIDYELLMEKWGNQDLFD